MTCPVCKKEVPRDSGFLPFCGERCKLIDLASRRKLALPGLAAAALESEDPRRGLRIPAKANADFEGNADGVPSRSRAVDVLL
jgi:endogenous inhibitor of DNA gyrase (YacG/DUF329 family)